MARRPCRWQSAASKPRRRRAGSRRRRSRSRPLGRTVRTLRRYNFGRAHAPLTPFHYLAMASYGGTGLEGVSVSWVCIKPDPSFSLGEEGAVRSLVTHIHCTCRHELQGVGKMTRDRHGNNTGMHATVFAALPQPGMINTSWSSVTSCQSVAISHILSLPSGPQEGIDCSTFGGCCRPRRSQSHTRLRTPSTRGGNGGAPPEGTPRRQPTPPWGASPTSWRATRTSCSRARARFGPDTSNPVGYCLLCCSIWRCRPRCTQSASSDANYP